MDILKPTEKPRKATGKKYTTTIPFGWRQSHGMKPGDTIDIYYGEGGVLMQNPVSRPLSEIERALIQLLMSVPKIQKSRELAQMLVDTGEKILSQA